MDKFIDTVTRNGLYFLVGFIIAASAACTLGQVLR